jgi:hypothetical protein
VFECKHDGVRDKKVKIRRLSFFLRLLP